MNYEHMSREDVAGLACENFHWIGTLISLAKTNSVHAETLLDIAEYLSDEQYANFDEMVK